jgi:urease beta subunit
MGPVIEYSIETQAGVLFTRAPAYGRQFKVKEAVCVRIKPDDIIIIPDNGAKDDDKAE